MNESLSPPDDVPIPPAEAELLERARAAAEAEDWIAAGHAGVAAAMLGSAEGARLTSQVAGPIRQLADGGSAPAAALLAGIFLEYFHESALPMAVAYARAAAEAGDPAGQRTYGYLLAEGVGVEADPVRAVELFAAASEGGDAFGAFNLAKRTEDAAASMLLLRRAAEGGLLMAGTALGDRLSALDRDEEALRWYVWAAERGQRGAVVTAACWYRDGYGGPSDPVQAVRWFFVMLAHGNGDGVHEAVQLARRAAMTHEQIREAGRLAGDPGASEVLIGTLGDTP